MRILFLIICISCTFCGYAQFPIGKPVTLAEKEIKQFLKAKGFTFYKQSGTDKYLELAYSEEFVVILSINGFGNVQSITYSPSKKILDRMLGTLGFGKWTKVESRPVKWSRYDIEFVYKYKDYQIVFVDLGSYNITITESP